MSDPLDLNEGHWQRIFSKKDVTILALVAHTFYRIEQVESSISSAGFCRGKTMHADRKFYWYLYPESVSRIGGLSGKEERELGKRIKKQGDQDAISRLADANLRLVICHPLVRSFWGDPRAFFDLVQAGRLGLLKAAQKFDYEIGCSFFIYARPHVESEIKKTFKEVAANSPLYIPRSTLEKVKLCRNTRRELERQHGHSIGPTEIVRALGLTVDRVEEILKAEVATYTPPESLDEIEGGTKPSVPGVEEEMIRKEEEVIEEEKVRALKESINSLPEKTRELFYVRYLSEEKVLPLPEVAKRIGISRDAAHQRDVRGRKYIRKQLEKGGFCE